MHAQSVQELIILKNARSMVFIPYGQRLASSAVKIWYATPLPQKP
jgi:hypothetical protein